MDGSSSPETKEAFLFNLINIMEVKFNCSKSDGASVHLCKEKDGVYLVNQFNDLDENYNPSQKLVSVFLSKSELRDFIGQLLHIQSTLNKK